jgi:hypothetical protein
MRLVTICVEIRDRDDENELDDIAEEVSLAVDHLESYKGWNVKDVQW